MIAMEANLLVFVQLSIVKHDRAFRALGPKSFGNLAALGLGTSDLRFLKKGRGRRDGRFGTPSHLRRVQAQYFLGEDGGRHMWRTRGHAKFEPSRELKSPRDSADDTPLDPKSNHGGTRIFSRSTISMACILAGLKAASNGPDANFT
jgi:hypothetical protein